MATGDSKAKITLTAEDKTRAAFASASRSLGNLGSQAGNIVGRLGGIGAALAAGMSALQIANVVQVADQLDDLSEKTGISVERLSALRFAGEAVGTELTSLTTGVRELSKRMADAAGGGKATSEAFRAIGVEVKNADGSLRSADEVLLDVADKFAQYEDGAAKAALAQELFGKSGADMIPFLNQGKQGIEELRREAEQLGVIYSGDLAKASAEFNDNLVKLRAAAEGLAVRLAGPVIQELARTSEFFLKAAKDAGILQAALITLGRGFAIRLGFDDVGRLQAQAEGQSRQIRALTFELERQQQRAAAGYGDAAGKVDELREKLHKLQSDAQRTSNALKGVADEIDGTDKPDSPAAKPAVAPPVVTRDASPKTARAAPDDYQSQLAQAVASAINDNAVTRAQRLADEMALLDKLFFDAGLSAEVYDAAMAKLTGTEQKLTVETSEFLREQQRLNELLEATPTAKLQELQNDMLLLAKAYEEGRFGAVGSAEAIERFNETAQTRLGTLPEDFKKQTDQMSEFAAEAARNIQDSLGDSLYEAMNGNFESIGDGFVQMINRMVAEALAAQLAQSLLGDFGKNGSTQIGGWAGQAVGWLGSLFGGARATGGPVEAGMLYRVNENNTEYFQPRVGGQIVPLARSEPSGAGRKSIAITVNQSFPANADRRTTTQAAADARRALEAGARNL